MAARNAPQSLRSALLVFFVLSLSFALPVDSAFGTAFAGQANVRTTCTRTEQAYLMEVCLTAPDADVSLEGEALIEATVEIDDRSIRVLSVDFAMDGRRVLSDFDKPYRFVLPVALWDAGLRNLSVSVRTSDKMRSEPITTQIMIAEDLEPVAAGASFMPATGRPVEGNGSFVVAAIGDSAGGSPESMAVANLIQMWDPNLLLYLGDVYNSGTYTEFLNWYHPEEFLGRFRDITLPTPGNHEYSGSDTPGGYMQYWGDPPHYYSVDTAGWHIVSLDSNPRFDQLDTPSAQMKWLDNDLANSASACKLVFFHHPPFSVGSYSNEGDDLRDLWRLMEKHKVTLVLTGHDHNYQRWERLDGNGQRHPAGVVSAIVGTGGQSEYGAKVLDDDRLAGPVLTTPGALRLDLNQSGLSMQFVTIDGITRDTDVVPCDQSSEDTQSPSPPEDLVTVEEEDGSITLQWQHAVDETGVLHYEVYRDETLLDGSVLGTAYVDVDPPNENAEYRVVAKDGAQNRSGPSSARINGHEPGADIVFADTFSSASLVRWDRSDGLAIEIAPEGTGWIARARGSTHDAWARWQLPDGEPDSLIVRVRFRVMAQGDNPVVLLRLRTSEGGSLMSVSVGANGTIGSYNDVTSSGTTSQQSIQEDTWHELTLLTSRVDGQRVVTILLDETAISELSGPADLGPEEISEIQLGDSTSGRVYDVQYSGIIVASSPLDVPADSSRQPLGRVGHVVGMTMLPRGRNGRQPGSSSPTRMLHPPWR